MDVWTTQLGGSMTNTLRLAGLNVTSTSYTSPSLLLAQALQTSASSVLVERQASYVSTPMRVEARSNVSLHTSLNLTQVGKSLEVYAAVWCESESAGMLYVGETSVVSVSSGRVVLGGSSIVMSGRLYTSGGNVTYQFCSRSATGSIDVGGDGTEGQGQIKLPHSVLQSMHTGPVTLLTAGNITVFSVTALDVAGVVELVTLSTIRRCPPTSPLDTYTSSPAACGRPCRCRLATV